MRTLEVGDRVLIRPVLGRIPGEPEFVAGGKILLLPQYRGGPYWVETDTPNPVTGQMLQYFWDDEMVRAPGKSSG